MFLDDITNLKKKDRWRPLSWF